MSTALEISLGYQRLLIWSTVTSVCLLSLVTDWSGKRGHLIKLLIFLNFNLVDLYHFWHTSATFSFKIKFLFKYTPWAIKTLISTDVMFVNSVKTNKHVFKNFSPSGSQAILVFPYQTAWQYCDGNPLNGGVECRWGRQKSRFWAWLHRALSTLHPARCYEHGVAGPWQVVTLFSPSGSQ